MAITVSAVSGGANTSISGYAKRENVLLGMHFLHQSGDCNTLGAGFQNTTPGYWDYVKYMPEDIAEMSYADFWHWWSEFERYKGDEKGLADFDAIVDSCLQHGMKVKVDIAWGTWWTINKDWEKDANTTFGPQDVDDWVHHCDTLARRYRGRVALWMLQGEANNLEIYWMNKPMEHVSEVYKLGYKAFKRIDPDTLISIAGASPSASREKLDEWVSTHVNNCKPMLDDVPMNYFADVYGADPYGGLVNYYNSIRDILDKAGLPNVEVGSGESAVQWALDSAQVTSKPPRWTPDPDSAKAQPPLSEEGQAWRLNETLGTFFNTGANKFMLWGTEYAPAAGWAWRWGFRKFQDWWGIWPDKWKVPGTNIVFGNAASDGKEVDLRVGWTSRETDPYHPMWSVYKFWAKATPPGAEAVRLHCDTKSGGPRVLRLASYLQTQDRCVVLLQNDEKSETAVNIDMSATGWADGTHLVGKLINRSVDYLNGDVTINDERFVRSKIAGGKASFRLSELSGFTSLEINPDNAGSAVEYLGAVCDETIEIGETAKCFVTLRNSGKNPWKRESVQLVFNDVEKYPLAAKLDRMIEPGETVTLAVNMPSGKSGGRVSRSLRFRSGNSFFGPSYPVCFKVVDMSAPRKLVAHREFGHIRLVWLTPERADRVKSYEVYRAEGFEQPFSLIATVDAATFIDEPPVKDKAYYYHVVAIDKGGRKSRPSNEDNAKAISQPWFWDAEITAEGLPHTAKLGELYNVTLHIKNTGSKTWDITRPESEFRLFLNTTQQWGVQDEALLPDIALGGKGVKPGETISITAAYAAPKAGRFENHWILSIDMPQKQRVYFGTPLIVETNVTE